MLTRKGLGLLVDDEDAVFARRDGPDQAQLCVDDSSALISGGRWRAIPRPASVSAQSCLGSSSS
jgi:hypothetical protein